MRQLQCYTCKQIKEESSFIKDKYAPRGYKSYCKECQSLKIIRKRISELKTPQDNTDYLIYLIVQKVRTVEQCSLYFQCDVNLILSELRCYGYDYDNTKWCPQCRKFRTLNFFSNDKHNKRFNKKCWCVNCWYKYTRLPEILERTKQQFQELYADPDKRAKRLQQSRDYYFNNLEARLEYCKEYYKEHSAEQHARVRARKLKIMKATPCWANLNAMIEIYKEAKCITDTTGVLHEVDHIIPLNGKNVSGLHVETNLQILTRDENRAKGNKFPYDLTLKG